MGARIRPLLSVLLASLVTAALAEAPSVDKLLQEATVLALRSREPQTRALCLAEIAVAWARAGNELASEEAGEQAVACALTVKGQMAQALSLRTVAVRLHTLQPDRARRLLADAARMARDLKYAAQRAVAMREVAIAAHEFGLDTAPQLAQEALQVAGQVDSPVFKAACLRDTAVGLHPYDAELAQDAFIEARKALEAAPPSDAGLPFARSELAAAWAPFDMPAAGQILDLIVDDRLRALALRSVARAVAPASPDMALALAQEIPASVARGCIVAAAAAALPQTSAPTAMALAQAALGVVGEARGEEAEDARADIAAAMAWLSPPQATALAATIKDQEVRNRAMATIAGRVGHSDPRAGIALLADVDDPVVTEPVVVELAIILATQAPEDALELVRGAMGRRLRVQGLLGIAATLPEDAQHE